MLARREPRRALGMATAIVTISLAAAPARADVTKADCVQADVKAQDARRGGKLSEARTQLQLCTQLACPAIVRDDCTRRLDDLERAQPTIQFKVKDASGSDVSAVKVSVDGVPLTDRLTGAPLPVDVGEHAFTLEVAGHAAITRRLVIQEAEKDRREVVSLADAPPPPAASVAAPGPTSEAAAPPPAKATMKTQKVLALVAGGVGVAGVAVGGVFGAMTLSSVSQQKKDCASSGSCQNPTQAASDYSTATTDRTIATVGFIAGGALIAAGVVLFCTTPSASEPSTASSLVVAPSSDGRGGYASWSGSF